MYLAKKWLFESSYDSIQYKPLLPLSPSPLPPSLSFNVKKFYPYFPLLHSVQQAVIVVIVICVYCSKNITVCNGRTYYRLSSY